MGYFFRVSNPGGFTIHPCTGALPVERYQISSAWASRFPASRSSFRWVSFTSGPTGSPGRRGRWKTTTSVGS